MALWPFMPQTPVVEGLEWMTDVIRCRSAEQRLCLRAAPREDWTLDHKLTPAQFSVAKELVKATGGGSIYVPVWTELSEVGTVGAHAVNVAVDATGKCYAAGGYLMVWESPEACEVVEIDTIGSGVINLTPWVVSAYSNALVCPVRVATFAQSLDVDRDASPDTVLVQARFEITATEDLSAGTGIAYDTYSTHPLVDDAAIVGSGIQEQYTREVETLDSGAGPLVKASIYDDPIQSSQVAWYAEGVADVLALREWLHKCKGRWKSFWVPSHNADIAISDDCDAGNAFVDILNIGFASIFALPCDFTIRDINGVQYPFRVTSVIASPGHPEWERLVLTAILITSGTLYLTNIARTSRLVLSRFDADRIEIQHGPAHSATVTAPIVEVPL